MPYSIPDDGLLAQSAGNPLLYATLYATFHLESLRTDDMQALEEAHELLAQYLGPALRWSWSTVHGEVTPFNATLFEYAAGHVLTLRNPHFDSSEPADVRATHALLDVRARDEVGFAAHGAVQRNQASPFSYRFSCEITGDSGEIFPNASALSFSVPHTAPLAQFREVVLSVAAKLRLRWATAGYGYGAWEFDAANSTTRARYGHARRHVGFDTGIDATLLDRFYDWPRTVNWLTLLGPSLSSRLPALVDLRAPQLKIEAIADNVLVTAGAAPQVGDQNRLDFPAPYVESDRLLRTLRDPTGLSFGQPWDERTTERWLRRFEVSGVPPVF